MDKDSILAEIKESLSGIKDIDYAYLFGSVLKGMLPDSDIDILLGGDFDFNRKTALTMELALRLKRNVDLILTKEASYELILKAFSQGVAIVINDRDSLRKDYFKSYFLFDANTSLRKTRLERVKRIYAP